VLREVGDPAVLGALVAAAGGEHHETGNRLRMVERRSEDPKLVRKDIAFEDGHAAML